MKLANGNYRLKSDPNPPGKPDMLFVVRNDGSYGDASFGRLEYDAGHDWYWVGKVVIRFLDATHFEAITNPGEPSETHYTGTYAPET